MGLLDGVGITNAHLGITKGRNMKALSIIGIVIGTISLFCIAAFMETQPDAAMGWGIIATLYFIPYSIVGLVKSGKKDFGAEVAKLKALKEAGTIDDVVYRSKVEALL